MTQLRQCKHCGTDISSMKASASYCSDKCRFDARNGKAKKKPLIIFWDTETRGLGGDAEASQYCYAYGSDVTNEAVLFESGECIEQTFNHIKQLWLSLGKPEIRLYAHNAAFDLMRTRTQLSESAFKGILSGGKLIAARLAYSDMMIECRDSMRLLNNSLKQLTKSFAPYMPKLEMNHLVGYEIGNPEHQEYARRDVLSLREVLINFAKGIDVPLHKLKYSTPGQAFSIMQGMHETSYGKYTALKEEMNKYFLKYYYVGGRIYIRNNHSPVEVAIAISFDITSSFPYQMSIQLFPLPGIAPRFVRGYIPENAGRFFVKCYVRNYQATLPVLPYRTFDENGEKKRTFYPHGSFTTYISDIEYNWVKKNQPETDLEVIFCEYWHSDVCERWLKPFIDKFYTMKRQGDELNAQEKGKGDALRSVAKLLLNALYGKFAQRYIEDEGDTVSWNGGEDFEIFKGAGKDHRNAHISAFITAGARCHLYDAIMFYGAENVLYSDTDSIKVYKHVYDAKGKMPTEGGNLGDWKNEGVYEDLQVIAPKVYIGSHEGKLEIKAKGFPVHNIAKLEIDGKEKLIERHKTDLEQNEEVDKLFQVEIQKAAKELKTITAFYEDKANQIKTFVKSGIMAEGVKKTLSYPDKITTMNYDKFEKAYRYIKVDELYNLEQLQKRELPGEKRKSPDIVTCSGDEASITRE